MSRLFHFLRLALHNLRRGGQRVWVALLCITFGVMALVAMTMIAECIQSAIDIPPAWLVGGDLSMVRASEDTIPPAAVEQLQSLHGTGEISDYTLIAYSSSIMFRVPATGQTHFGGNGMGIEPEKYPLMGTFLIGEPGGTGLSTLLQKPGDVIVTREIAETYRLRIGDEIILADLRLGAPIQGTVRGVAYDTPNHRGEKIYYSMATARALAGGGAVVNTAIVNTPHPDRLTTQLENSGWSVDWVERRLASNPGNMWMIGLRGAGILGLLVSGIGIANTMQVLLRRRQREIAIWKTLGYRAGDLRLIFSLEAAMLGLGGSLLGAGLGILFSTGLLQVLRRTSSLLYPWTFQPVPPLMGILVGTLTTILFALWAILVAGQARPVALLRNEPVDARTATGCGSFLLALLLAIPFTALASLVMGSLKNGILMLAAILIGLSLLGVAFHLALWFSSRLLGLAASHWMRIALKSLRRGGLALTFAMIALFIGALSMGLGALVAEIGLMGRLSGLADIGGYNFNLLAPARVAQDARAALEALQPEMLDVGYRLSLDSVTTSNGEPLAHTEAMLMGYSDPSDFTLQGAPWGSMPDGVYVYSASDLQPGSQIELTLRDGSHASLSVAGSYDPNFRSANPYPPLGLLVSDAAFTQIAQPDSVVYFARIDPARLDAALGSLGRSLPEATLVDLAAYNTRFMQGYEGSFILPFSLAALALLAGLLLVANSVSLAMQDRRYEIGILKTSGYSRKQILGILAVEYGLASVLASGAGMLAVEAMLGLLAFTSGEPLKVLAMGLAPILLMLLAGVGLTLLTVLGVTWNPASLAPALVLNERT